MTVSVLIPAYRAAHTIGQTIDSLLAQTLPPEEILVIDDGSPDEITAALAPYGDRITLLRKENGGAASARNLGLDHARGDLIAFVDADDTWEPQKLERQLSILAKHPEVGLCAGEFFMRWPHAKERYLARNLLPDTQDRVLRLGNGDAFRVATRIWTSMVLVRRKVLCMGRFDTSLRTAEDVDLWIKLVLAAPIYLTSEPLATQVLTAGSLSRSDVGADYRNMLRVIQSHADLLGPAGVQAEELRVYRQWAADHLGEGKARAALRPAWKRLRRQPLSLQAWWIVFKASLRSCLPGGGGRKAGGLKA